MQQAAGPLGRGRPWPSQIFAAVYSIVRDKIKMEMQALSMTCQHLNTYASIELSQMRSEIIALELKILDLQMEVCILRALYKVWKAFANSLCSSH